MEIPRIASPPSSRVLDQMSYNDTRAPGSRSNSQTSSSFHLSPAPMTIPNSRPAEAPPPLPPPRIIPALANGHDLSWAWSNPMREEGFGKLAPINPGSSLNGGYWRALPDTSRDEEATEEMDVDGEFDRRGSNVSTIRSPSHPELFPGNLGYIQSGGKRTPSPSAISNQRLQGEKPLAQENLSRSSHAYDKHVLSKIGKGNSPPRQKSLGPGENAITAQKLPSRPADRNGVQRLSVTELATNSADSWSKWVTSPVSGGLSPNTKHSWRDYSMSYRSPSVDSSAPPSVLDPDSHTRPRGPIRHSTTGSLPGLDDSFSSCSRSNRGSYDRAFSPEADADFPMEETGGLRELSLGGPTPSDPHGRQNLSKQGMKRRALSPPTAAAREDKALLFTADAHQKQSAPANYSRSPISRQDPSHSSVSSVSSASLRNNSLASSVGLSIAASSVTSVSSLDTHSPGAISPLSDFGPPKDSPYITSVSLNPSQASITPARPHQQNREPKPVSTARKMSIQSAVNQNRHSNASRIAGQFMCECCPKKPKKFESEEELRAHEMEKQYTCQFCHNRFKNKNEAERHQNSLHLRRHSWSCNAISGYQAAFHPSTSPSSHTANGPANDACGYCGEEFPNHPQPDWDRRIEHLTNVHKFGECNQAKKFYRADHFRQHLKHSHAGASGKWTNMLENACMKDEPAVEASGTGPGIGEQSRGPSSLPTSGTVMDGETIKESHEES